MAAFRKLVPVVLLTWAGLLALQSLIGLWVPRVSPTVGDVATTFLYCILPAVVLAFRSPKARRRGLDSSRSTSGASSPPVADGR